MQSLTFAASLHSSLASNDVSKVGTAGASAATAPVLMNIHIHIDINIKTNININIHICININNIKNINPPTLRAPEVRRLESGVRNLKIERLMGEGTPYPLIGGGGGGGRSLFDLKTVWKHVFE